MTTRSAGLRKAIKAAGSINKLARSLKLTRQAVSGWDRIPAERLGDVHRATGVPQEQLRPDLF